MRQTLDAAIHRLEEAIAIRPAHYEPLLEAFRALEVPGDVPAGDLSRIYEACFAILGIKGAQSFDASALAPREAGHITYCARDVVERTMHDPDGRTRRWIAERRQWHEARGLEIPEGYDDSELPPALTLPWDETDASRHIRPFLDHLEAQVREQPLSHLSLCWKVRHEGYPVFRAVMVRWMKDLEKKGLGPPGTVAAFDTVDRLDGLGFELEDEPWATVCDKLMGLLEDEHPMVAAAAGRCLGGLVADEGGEDEEDGRRADWPRLPKLLDLLRSVKGHRVHVAGGFVDGFDTSAMEGLGGLKSQALLADAGFDFEQWVLDILAQDPLEPYLPNAQAFWFYVHECYDLDPAFSHRLLDADRSFVALMCATERDERVEGMAAVLERLAGDADTWIADAARRHLDRVYRAP
ncbi:MAG: hypothetical protein R3D44_18460 [Hyphomicrobiaceae bacterium]